MRLELASRLIPGMEVWDAVEVELAVPFILLIAQTVSPEIDVVETRTFFAKPHHLASLSDSADVRFSCVEVFSPPHLNGTAVWQLDPVSELWECREVVDGAVAWLYVLADGRLLSDSPRHSPGSDLVRHSRIYKSLS
jgi:hypothetical protein